MTKKFISKADSSESKLLSARVRASNAGILATLVSIGSLQPNPAQPRRVINETELENLAASIKKHGFLQPIVAKATGDGTYLIIAGERRWRAAKLLNEEKVPVLLRDTEADDLRTLGLIENLQRENLHPVDEMRALDELKEQFGTHEKAAAVLGMKRETFTNKTRFLVLGTEILEVCTKVKNLSYSQLSRLLSLPEPKRLLAAKQLAGLAPVTEKTTSPKPKKTPFKFVHKEKGRSFSVVFTARQKEVTLRDYVDGLRLALEEAETRLEKEQAAEE